MHVFLWTFEYRRKLRVNKAIKQTALIEDASDTYVFCNNYLKYSFLMLVYIVRFGWDIALSSSYDGWDKHGYTMWCHRDGTSTLLNCVWLCLKVVQIERT